MSIFSRPKATEERLKMYVYGESGTGKTVTALQFPNVVVVDTEKGTTFYREDFDNFPVVYSSDPKVALDGVEELLKDPGDRKTLVLDSFTVLYDNIVRNREEEMKLRTGNPSYEIQPLDYKFIKNEVKMLSDKILSLDMNIVVTARSKVLYSKEKFMEPIGFTPEGPKELPYIFDVVIELSKDAKTGKHIATVKKDRTNKLPPKFEYSYDAFINYIGEESLGRAASLDRQQENLDSRRSRNTEITIDGAKIKTAGVTAKTLKALQELTVDAKEDVLLDLLKEEYGVDSMLDLSDKAAKSLLSVIQQQQKN